MGVLGDIGKPLFCHWVYLGYYVALKIYFRRDWPSDFLTVSPAPRAPSSFVLFCFFFAVFLGLLLAMHRNMP
jgi:hypothetical protein